MGNEIYDEKKVIEDVMEMIELHKDGCLITTEDDFYNLEILLNLIENQSKEIEELKGKNEHITKETVDFVNTHYISKDKIKAKIVELGNMKVSGDVFITSVNFAIKILQELLKEE